MDHAYRNHVEVMSRRFACEAAHEHALPRAPEALFRVPARRGAEVTQPLAPGACFQATRLAVANLNVAESGASRRERDQLRLDRGCVHRVRASARWREHREREERDELHPRLYAAARRPSTRSIQSRCGFCVTRKPARRSASSSSSETAASATPSAFQTLKRTCGSSVR